MMHYWSFGDVISHIVVVIVVVFILVWALRMIFGGGRRMRGMRWHNMMQDHMGAMHTLRERYAKGEISKEEFEEKKKVLME